MAEMLACEKCSRVLFEKDDLFTVDFCDVQNLTVVGYFVCQECHHRIQKFVTEEHFYDEMARNFFRRNIEEQTA